MSDIKHISAFKAQQIVRRIKQLGAPYEFTRYEVNQYGERTKNEKLRITHDGIFHTQKAYVSRPTADATVSYTKDSPMLLLTYEGYSESPLVYKDIVTISGVDYEVLDATNVSEGNFAIDISLGELR